MLFVVAVGYLHDPPFSAATAVWALDMVLYLI